MHNNLRLSAPPARVANSVHFVRSAVLWEAS